MVCSSLYPTDCSAFRAKNIKNQPQVNKKLPKKEVLQTYTHEIGDLKDQLVTMRQQGGVYLPASQYERMVNSVKERKEKVTELETALIAKDHEIAAIQETFEKQEQQLVSSSFELLTYIVQEEKKEALEKTQEILTETTDKLKDTEATLTSVQSSLREHTVVLTEHEETEGKFHSQADEVLGTLSGTVLAVGGLHEKIGMFVDQVCV